MQKYQVTVMAIPAVVESVTFIDDVTSVHHLDVNAMLMHIINCCKQSFDCVSLLHVVNIILVDQNMVVVHSGVCPCRWWYLIQMKIDWFEA